MPEAEIINGLGVQRVPYQTSLYRRVAAAGGKVSLAQKERMRRNDGRRPQNRSTLINFFPHVVQEFADEF